MQHCWRQGAEACSNSPTRNPAAEGEAAAGDGADAPADGAAPGAHSARLTALLAAIEEEGGGAVPPAPDAGDADALAALLGRLDLVLTWLWRVHGVDYYSGR